MDVSQHNYKKDSRIDKSVKNNGIINGNVNTGSVHSESSKSSKIPIVAAVLSAVIISIGAIVAAYLK